MEHKNKKEEKSNSNTSDQKAQGAQNKQSNAVKDKNAKPSNKEGNSNQKKK